jgi:hypothetical protein
LPYYINKNLPLIPGKKAFSIFWSAFLYFNIFTYTYN